MSAYTATIGLEVHVQLKTRSKLFCGCPTGFGAAPNTQVCPVCLGYPGAMPALNGEAVRLTVLTGLTIGSRILSPSTFDRKSYFYPDMPKNYQVSQYDRPLCLGGSVEAAMSDGARSIEITRIHLEEDVGKSIHAGRYSGVDFNRAGLPLMEIVTEPLMHSPEEAFAFLQALKQILQYIDVSDCNLEQGNLRCDVNVSVHPSGQSGLGTKTEIKNMNTFRGVLHALRYEIVRQTELLEAGGRVVQETRRWDPDAEITESMRGKEDAHDYRYFREPDLMPVDIDEERLEQWRAGLPELPDSRRARWMDSYGLPEYDARVLSADRALADFFEMAVGFCRQPKAVSNLLMTEVLRLVTELDTRIEDSALCPRALAELVMLLERHTINQPTAKVLLSELFEDGGMPGALVASRGLAQVSDDDAIQEWVSAAVRANSGAVSDFLDGKPAAAKFLVGQVMKASRGQADPKAVGRRVEAELERLRP